MSASEYPEVADMRAFYLAECEPRYVKGRAEYGTQAVDASALENVEAALEEVADLLFYLRQAVRKLRPPPVVA